jgi:hypothetical protein
VRQKISAYALIVCSVVKKKTVGSSETCSTKGADKSLAL